MKKLPWRGVLYAVMLVYLFLDLKACHGPLRKAMMSRRNEGIEAAIKYKWVALINQEPVTQEQLDLAVVRHLYQRGKTPADIPEKNLSMMRRAVLQTLIDDTLVRHYADGEGFRAPEAEIDQFISNWKAQFEAPEEIATRAAVQGLDEKGIEAELARIWSRKRWLEKRIAPAVTVTEAEASEWFKRNHQTPEGVLQPGFFEPEKVRARHIFLSTVEVDDKTREDLIRSIHLKLKNKEASFEALAKAHSEDPRTKDQGGDLNWFSRERMPEDFTTPVFALKPEELSEPFRTRLGWHLVEVMDRQEKRLLTYEETKDEIIAYLESERTEETVKVLMEKLRKVANIQLFPENI